MNEKHNVAMVNLNKPTFVPVKVEGWTLFASDGGEHWLRDLDLAERAELANQRDIRTHIKKAIDDGAITLVDSVAVGDATNGPGTYAVDEVVPRGDRGATQTGKVYYLNEEAALVVLMRLRTPKAVEVTKAVVRVFLAVVRGEIPQKIYVPANDIEAQVRLLALRQKEALAIYLMAPDLFGKDYLRHKVEHAAALVTGEKPVVEISLLSVEGYLQERGVDARTRKSKASSFGKRVKAVYFEKYGEYPPMQARDINHAERRVCSYSEKDRPVFDQVFEEMFSGQAMRALDLNTLSGEVPEPVPPPPPPPTVNTSVEGWSLRGLLERFKHAGMTGLTEGKIRDAATSLGLTGDVRYGHQSTITVDGRRVVSRPWRYNEEAAVVLEPALRLYLRNLAGGVGAQNAMTSAVTMTGKVGTGPRSRVRFNAIRAPG
jgi:hypothetical protein